MGDCFQSLERMPSLVIMASGPQFAALYDSYTQRPPTMVLSMGMSINDMGSTRRGSRPSTTRSASLPAVMLPLRFSSNDAYAPLMVPTRLERPGQIVRGLRHSNARVQKTAHANIQFRRSAPYPLDQPRVHHRAMLQAVARIAAGHFALQALVDAEHHVDGRIAVGVRGDLPPGLARFSRDGV